MATGKSVKSLGSSSSRASITKSVSKPKTTTTSKVSVPTKTSTISLRKAATPSSSSGSSSSSSAGKSIAPVVSASNAARSNITSAVNNAAASKSSTGSSSSAGKSVSSLTNGSNSARAKISSAVSSRSSGGSSSSKSSGGSTSSNVAKSLSPLLDKEQEMRNAIKSVALPGYDGGDQPYAKTLAGYENASNTNFVNAYNHLRSQGMSDEEAGAAAAGLLENENLLKNKSDDEIAMETQNNNDDDDYDYLNDIMNGEEEGEEEEPYYPDFDELFGDYIDRYERRIEDLESQLESNTVKKSVPEERDTSYDYNTYYQENLAPDTMYENGVSKNDLNDKPQVTLVSQYQEPVSTALNDLGLLSPNEAVTNATPNAEEPGLPKGYESGEAIVDGFNNALEEISQDNGLTPQAVAQAYSDFKNQLVQYANTNNMNPEEYKMLLKQLQNNDVLREVLLNNGRKGLANRNLR